MAPVTICPYPPVMLLVSPPDPPRMVNSAYVAPGGATHWVSLAEQLLVDTALTIDGPLWVMKTVARTV
jgi:hypothetical protein